MNLIELEDLKCSYDGKDFKISWRVPNEFKDKVKYIIVAELYNGTIEINNDRLYKLEKGTKDKQVPPDPDIKDRERSFLVVGIDQDNKISIGELKELCYKHDKRKITCIGLKALGRIYWKVNVGNDRIALISIKSHIDVPEGYLAYSYEYCGVKFEFPVFGEIVNDTIRIINFFLPVGAENITLVSPGTAIQLLEDSGKSGIFEKIKMMFKKQ